MRFKNKRLIKKVLLFFVGCIILFGVVTNDAPNDVLKDTNDNNPVTNTLPLPHSTTPSVASQALVQLPIKGRAAKTGYDRDLFSGGWAEVDGCDMRNFILQRDLESEVLGSDNCTVLTGTLLDPYTGQVIAFTRGETTSDNVQIDHIVALSDAWQKGAQQLAAEQRYTFYNDPLNLLAVDGPTNSSKGDSDAATWLPPNTTFRCEYVARQIAVKQKYSLWVTEAEFNKMSELLATCPEQTIPVE